MSDEPTKCVNCGRPPMYIDIGGDIQFQGYLCATLSCNDKRRKQRALERWEAQNHE